MFTVYRKTADEPIRPLDVLNTPDPAEAEAHYERLKGVRTEGPGAVLLVSPDPVRYPNGRYRTDRVWHGGHRERVIERLLGGVTG